MENTENMEQPLCGETTSNVGEQNTQEMTADVSETQGSNYGKFKDAATLLDAYLNLEKSFTKKSQMLAELLKEKQDVAGTMAEEKAIETPNEKEETSDNQPETYLSYKDANWKTNAENFLLKNEDARAYAKEIANLLLEDKSLAASPNCLEYAYALVKSRHTKDPAELLNDPSYIEENILKNDQIRNMVINEYLSSVKEGNTPLKFITGNTTTVSLQKPDNKPKTIKEASMLLKKILNN